MQQVLSDLLVLKATTGIGAVAGHNLLVGAVEWLRQLPASDLGALVIFDLAQVDIATTAFLKSSVLPLYQSGRLSTEAGAQTLADAFSVPAFNVYPMIANAAPEVEELADEIFGRRGFPLLSLRLASDSSTPMGGRMIGFVDDALSKTMRRWLDAEKHTAATLHERFPHEGITQTAWSNRLNDLWRLRLLRRARQGKTWMYQPIANGVNYG